MMGTWRDVTGRGEQQEYCGGDGKQGSGNGENPMQPDCDVRIACAVCRNAKYDAMRCVLYRGRERSVRYRLE